MRSCVIACTRTFVGAFVCDCVYTCDSLRVRVLEREREGERERERERAFV